MVYDAALEQLLAEHCAPVLLGVKCANLISVCKKQFPKLNEHLRQYNRRFRTIGLVFVILRSCTVRSLVLIYRPALMRKQLSKPGTAALLQEFGYDPTMPMAQMFNKLCRKMRQGEDFPHELGLFLGYPPQDVSGFIRNCGADCKLCGYWKVYGDVEEARRCFACYDACRALLTRHVQAGYTISELLCAA